MYINIIKNKRAFFLGVMLIILISGSIIYTNKMQEQFPEITFDTLEKTIVQQESQLYIKTQEKISALIGKDVFISVTSRTFIHIIFIALALLIILITQSIYVFLIEKEQTLALAEKKIVNKFLVSSDFQKFKTTAEHLLKTRVNTDINYIIIKLNIVNFQSVKKNYGADASDNFFKTIAKIFYNLTNDELDTFTRINNGQFLLLLHYTNITAFEEKKRFFDQALTALLDEFPDSKIVLTEGRYDIPVNETDIISIFEKVNIAHDLVKI